MIKLFEQYNEYSQVKDWLNSMRISNYTINADLTVDVNGSVELNKKGLSEIPIQFNKVSGYFVCSENRLTTLKGCPKYVGNFFACNDNGLTTLQYAPQEVDSTIFTSVNPLPFEILNFNHKHMLFKHQDDYGIWNEDGTFNKARFDIFLNDFNAGILD